VKLGGEGGEGVEISLRDEPWVRLRCGHVSARSWATRKRARFGCGGGKVPSKRRHRVRKEKKFQMKVKMTWRIICGTRKQAETKRRSGKDETKEKVL